MIGGSSLDRLGKVSAEHRLGAEIDREIGLELRAIEVWIEIVAGTGDAGDPTLRSFGDGAHRGAGRRGMAAGAGREVEVLPVFLVSVRLRRNDREEDRDLGVARHVEKPEAKSRTV